MICDSEHLKCAGRRILCNNSDCMAWCKQGTELVCTFRPGKSIKLTSFMWVTRTIVIGTDTSSYWLGEIFSLDVCLAGCNTMRFGICIRQMSGRTLKRSEQM